MNQDGIPNAAGHHASHPRLEISDPAFLTHKSVLRVAAVLLLPAVLLGQTDAEHCRPLISGTAVLIIMDRHTLIFPRSRIPPGQITPHLSLRFQAAHFVVWCCRRRPLEFSSLPLNGQWQHAWRNSPPSSRNFFLDAELCRSRETRVGISRSHPRHLHPHNDRRLLSDARSVRIPTERGTGRPIYHYSRGKFSLLLLATI